jgi:hypothetical protein
MKNVTRVIAIGLIGVLGSAISFATFQAGTPLNLAPKSLVKGKLGEWVGSGNAIYKVDSYESGLRDYRQKFNQAGKVIRPGYPKDRIAVIQIEIRNITDHPILPPLFTPALTDTDGVRTTDWKLDTRQVSFVTDHPRDSREDSSSPAEIAAGQIMKLALVFSISPKARPTAIEFAPQNFRVFHFGEISRYSQRSRMSPPPEHVLGPRPAEPNRQPEPAVRILIDLVPAPPKSS